MNLSVKAHSPTEQTEKFLKDIDYPYGSWNVYTLRKNAVVCWLHNDQRETVGFIWFCAIPDTYRGLEFHIAIHPKYQKKWLTKKNYKKLS